MTEETQALVRQLLEWVDGQSVTYASVLMQDAAAALTSLARDLETARQQNAALAEPALMGNCYKAERDACRAERAVLQADLAAARQALADLTAEPICLLRDYEAMRQERDAALANCKNWWKLRAELATKQNDTLCAERDAAVRAARAETWAEAALLAGHSATAIRHMRQAFVASPVMGELAVVRAEALEQFAKGLHERATAAREGQ